MDSIETDDLCMLRRVSVVGPGRLGRAVSAAMSQAGIDVAGPFGRHEPVAPSDAVLLCVPDPEIQAAALAVAGVAPLTGHTSGATDLDPLLPAAGEAFGLHPLQTFAGGEGPESFLGVGCAVAGTSHRALALAHALARALGMRAFELADADRGSYHAAASVASNFLVTLEHAAEQIAGGAGLDPDEARALLAPLVRGTVENWAERGPAASLTGPVARGNSETVDRQRAAVAQVAPDFLALFDVMVEHTRTLSTVGVPA